MYGLVTSLVFFSNFVPKTHRFWDIRLGSIPGFGVTHGHRKWYYRSGTHDFLLTFHNNHRPISHRFWHKRRFPFENRQFFPPPCIYSPRWRSYPSNWVSASAYGSEETRTMGLPQMVTQILESLCMFNWCSIHCNFSLANNLQKKLGRLTFFRHTV